MIVPPYQIEARWLRHHLKLELDAVDSIIDDDEASKINFMASIFDVDDWGHGHLKSNLDGHQNYLDSKLDGRQNHLDPILPSPSQIRYLATKWPSKIEARRGNFNFKEIRYSPAASSGHALKSKLAASDPDLVDISWYNKF